MFKTIINNFKCIDHIINDKFNEIQKINLKKTYLMKLIQREQIWGSREWVKDIIEENSKRILGVIFKY
jgi:hypothetical protein